MTTEAKQLSMEFLAAIKKGDLGAVFDCLAKGADPNSVNDYGTSMIAFSVIHDQKEILETLLEHGANPTIKNKDGLSAEDIAAKDNHIECLKIIGKYQRKNASKFKNGLFPFTKEEDTKTAHIEYREFPRSEEFENKFHQDTIEIVNEQVKYKKHQLRVGDVGGGDAFSTQILSKDFERQITYLERQAEKPYYARLDIKRLESGYVESYYIGSRGIYSDTDRVYAAQSPYGGLFAQKKLGKLNDKELGDIEVTLIRNIENDKGKIIQIIDKEWTEDKGYVDPVLMKKLNDHAKSKMNEIWETIQAEQDTVVRQGISVPIIVQGSAGSGKTVIALHRLSYLLYQYKGQLEEKKIMVLGPSAMYLSYIQEALPFLDVGEIRQETFEKFCKSRLPFAELRFSISDYYDIVRENLSTHSVQSSSIKGSLQYQTALKEFLNGLAEMLMPRSGVYLYTPIGEFSFPKERIEYLFKEYTTNRNFESAKIRIIDMLKSEYIRFKEKLSGQHSVKSLEYIDQLDSSVSQFIKNWKIPNLFEIYHKFSTNKALLGKYFKLEPEALEKFISENNENFKGKIVTHDDLAVLLEIQEWLTGKIGIEDGKITSQKFDYIIIDEVQDYSPYQVALIKSLAKDGRIMMLGDLGQSIHEYRGIEDWKNIREVFSMDNPEELGYIELSTIYRSTVQIVQFANRLIRPYSYQRYQLSEPIGREGTEPIIQEYKHEKDKFKELSLHIDTLRQEDHSNIAVITKCWGEAKEVYINLRKVYPELELIEDSSKEYKGGMIVLPVYLTKGIEYDAVILTDASIKHYSDNDHNRKLLYVAITRALHKVIVLYNRTLALPILDIIDRKAADELRAELRKNNVKKPELDNSIDEKGQFLESVQKGIDKLLSQYTSTIDILNSENTSLRMQLEQTKNSSVITRFVTVEKEALLNFILESDQSIVKYLDSLKKQTPEEREMLLVSVIQELIQLNKLMSVIKVFDYYEKSYSNLDNISASAGQEFLKSLNLLLDKLQVHIKEGTLILIKALAIAKSTEKQIQHEFLDNSYSQLNQAVISQENVPLILSVMNWYFELEKEEQLNSLVDYLLNNWSQLETQFTKPNIIRLLWYTFNIKKDLKLLKIMNRELLDPKIGEVKLYLNCYKVMQGNLTEASNIPVLLDQSTLFSKIELERIKRGIKERAKMYDL